jgi:hypothetical protein
VHCTVGGGNGQEVGMDRGAGGWRELRVPAIIAVCI